MPIQAPLELAFQLMNRIGATPGLDNTVRTLFEIVGDNLGGTSLALYYRLGDDIYRVDPSGNKQQMDVIDDLHVRKAFETGTPIESAQDDEGPDARKKSRPAKTFIWAVPLLTGGEPVAVIRIDGLRLPLREIPGPLKPLFHHAAFVLQNEILRILLQKTQGAPEQSRAGEEIQAVKASVEEGQEQRTRELAASEARFRTIYESAPVSIWREDWSGVIRDVKALRAKGIGDFDTYFREHPDFVEQALHKVKILDVNRWTLGLFEAAEKADILASLATIFDTEDVLPGFVGELLALAGGATAYQAEMALNTVKGNRLQVSLGICFPSPGSDSGEVLVSLVNITERKRFEQALQRSEEQMRLFFERPLVGMAITSPEKGWVQVNDKICEILGYTREELLGMTWEQVTYPEDLASGFTQFEQLRRGEIEGYTLEKRYRHKDGHIVYTILSVGCVRKADGTLDYILSVMEDITEQKNFEKGLQQSEERMRLFFERQLVGMAITSPEKGWIKFNDKICEMLGYSREELPRMTWAEITDPEDLEADLAQFERLRKGEIDHYALEKRYRHKDGHIVYAILSAGCVRKADGTLDYALSLIEDITERKLAEEAIRTLNATLEERVNQRTAQLNEAIGSLNVEIAERKLAEETLQHLNRELRALSNCNQTLMRAEDELHLLQNICRIVCEEAGYRMAWVGFAEHDEEQTIRPVAWAGFEEGFLSYLRSVWSDTEHGNGLTATAIHTGQTSCIQDFATEPRALPWRDRILPLGYRCGISMPLKDSNDVTFGALTIYASEPDAFTTAEKRLLEELAGDLAFGITNLRLRAEHNRAEKALRESEERFKGLMEQSPLSIQILEPGGKTLQINQAFEKLWGLSLEDLRSYNILEDPQLEKLGVMVDIKRGFAGENRKMKRVEYDSAHLSEKGKKRWIEGNVYPLKDEQGKVRNLILIHEDVTERVLWEAALRNAKEAAEAANCAKDQFIAVLSHELRTPLTPVLAAISALEEQHTLPPDLQSEVSLIHRNVKLEARLIDDLLDITKISRGQIELHLESVDVHSVLRTALEICQEDIASKQMQITLALNANPHHALADPTRLRQVFWNLIKNAVAFTPEGGRISLRTANIGNRLLIEVEDTGTGIRPELLPKIFNAFERGDQPPSRRFGGLGLGLSIAKTIVDMHRGALTAFSKGEGKGSTFTVALPPTIPPIETAPHPAPAVSAGNPSAKILLVDDHPDTLGTMARLLKKWGYTVVTGNSVQAALALAAKEPFDLLVSDLGLPDGSGMDIMRQVKNLYGLHGIALSGYGTDEDIRQSREAGFGEHLVKPVSFQALHDAIRRATSGPEETGEEPRSQRF